MRYLIVTITALLINFTANAEEKRTITVSLLSPSSGWSISIDEVYKVDKELWVIASLSNHPGPGLQVITTVKDSIEITAEDLPLKHFVLGKTWNWENKEDMTFIKDRKDIADDLAKGTRLYTKEKK